MRRRMNSDTSEVAWQLLEAAPHRDLTVRKSATRVDAGIILHALDSSGHRHLLLPIEQSASDLEDAKSRGVTVETRTLLEGEAEDERRFIDVKCEDVALNDLFSKVCDEILDLCEQTPSAAGAAVTVVLERWRELLGPASSRLLGDQELKGLLAELHVLESLVSAAPRQAFKIWTGVDKARHDFTGLRAACEVKASSLVDEVKIHIHGLTQLVPPPSSKLFLTIERFERVPLGADSLPDALGRLEHAGLDRHELLTAVAKVGVKPADLAAYAAVRFKSLERRVYEIGPDFPRLTPELLIGTMGADRISSVEYVLNLGAQPPVPLGKHAIDELSGWLLDGVEQIS